MTAGHRCNMCNAHRECVELADCAWAKRLDAWLQQVYPKHNVVVTNYGQGSWNTGTFLRHMDLLQKLDRVDLVIVDFAINDVFVKVQDQHRATRKLVQALSQHEDHPAVVYTASFDKSTAVGNHFLAHLCGSSTRVSDVSSPVVIDELNLPVISFLDADCMGHTSEDPQELWPTAQQLGGTNKHPPWHTHQVYADLIAYAWTKEAIKVCQFGPPELSINHTAVSVEDMPQDCFLHTFSMTSDAKFKGEADALSPQTMTEWSLYEDVPGKPGWITKAPGESCTSY